MIQVLQSHVIALIAAGEVIHSPRDVLKELIENALDAQGTEITIDLKYGGIEHIAVHDNGTGLSAQDLNLAPQRHATSKIQTIDDLLAVRSYGFRGEGLYAIASVCNFSMQSRTVHDMLGHKIAITLPDRKTVASVCSMNIGTSVICDQLFAPIPVRRKLLKNPRLELKKSLETIKALCLIHKTVSVRVRENQDMVLHLQSHSSDFVDRLIQAFPGTQKHLWVFSQRTFDQGSVQGWFYPESTKGLEQLWYLNDRWFVQNVFIKLAQRYTEHGLLVVQLQLRPDQIDVNMHPQKHQFGFYRQEALLSSLGDFFLDWIGMPCTSFETKEKVLAGLSERSNNVVVGSYYSPSQASSNFSRTHLVSPGAVVQVLEAQRETREHLGSKARHNIPRPQILFLESHLALFSASDLVIFNPFSLLQDIAQQSMLIPLADPIVIFKAETSSMLKNLGLTIDHDTIIALPAAIDRYILMTWLCEENDDILKLYQLLHETFIQFMVSQDDLLVWIQAHKSFIGIKNIKDLTQLLINA